MNDTIYTWPDLDAGNRRHYAKRPAEIYAAEEHARSAWKEYDRLIESGASCQEIEQAGMQSEAAEAFAMDLRDAWHSGSALQLEAAARLVLANI
jgi:hypothetical protein